jgi:hypothetical protein
MVVNRFRAFLFDKAAFSFNNLFQARPEAPAGLDEVAGRKGPPGLGHRGLEIGNVGVGSLTGLRFNDTPHRIVEGVEV